MLSNEPYPPQNRASLGRLNGKKWFFLSIALAECMRYTNINIHIQETKRGAEDLRNFKNFLVLIGEIPRLGFGSARLE